MEYIHDAQAHYMCSTQDGEIDGACETSLFSLHDFFGGFPKIQTDFMTDLRDAKLLFSESRNVSYFANWRHA